MNNAVVNIMLRRVGRIWECKATCALHDTTSIENDIDNKEIILQSALDKLPCNCWSSDDQH